MEAQGLPILNSKNNPMCMLGIVTCPLWTSGLDDLQSPFLTPPFYDFAMSSIHSPIHSTFTEHLTRTCATCYQGKARSLYQVSIECHVSVGNNIGDMYIYTHMCRHAKLLHLCPALWKPHGLYPTRLSVHGILQVRILEWVAMLSFRGSSWPRDWTCGCVPYISCIGRRVLLPLASRGKPMCVCMCV